MSLKLIVPLGSHGNIALRNIPKSSILEHINLDELTMRILKTPTRGQLISILNIKHRWKALQDKIHKSLPLSRRTCMKSNHKTLLDSYLYYR